MKRKTVGILALVLVLALAGCVPVPQPEQPASAGANVRTEKALNVQNDLNVGGTLGVTGVATFGDAPIWNTGSMVFEGATADAYETTLAITDPTTPDKTITLPNATGTVMLSSLATNAVDVANAVTGASNGLVFEGATANAYETTIAPTDPTADRTITLPNISGTVGLMITPGVVSFGSNVITGTLGISHGVTTPQTAFCTMGADPVNDEEDRCTVTISGATVTVKVWKEASTPTAGDSGVLVYWQVAGQP
jgi:hypothetical protein